MRFSKKRAFTLVEIMIVVLIIGILLAIAVPNFVTARDQSRQRACISNLEEISAAKEEWAMDTRAADTATPTQASLLGSGNAADGYLKSWPSCPSNGVYTIGQVQNNPTCTISGHSLTASFD